MQASVQAPVTKPASPDMMRIAVDEWPPYETESAEHYGGALRIITEAFALEGVDVGYAWMPWKRCLVAAASGELDGAALSQKTAEREKSFYFSDDIMSVKKVFFHMKAYDFDWNDYADLKGIAIGVPGGNVFGVDFERAREKGELEIQEVVTQFDQNFRKLLYGRIQLFPSELEAGYDYLRKNMASQRHLFTHHPKPVQVVTYHLVLSKKSDKNKQMLERFNRGLRQLKQQGKDQLYLLESIQGKYKKQ